MPQLDSQPEIIGREEELRKLRENLRKASEGQGGTLFILGEAGVGKTRLLEEIKSEARFKGFRILSGNSLHESLTPYMPFLEALRSGGLEHLFAEEAPNVEAAYLVTNTGLLIKEVLREETELDPDMFASMLTTVGDFVKDSLSMLSGEEKDGTLNTLGYEDYRILIESGRNTNLVVVITGREIEFLVYDMREIVARVDKDYGSALRQWSGDEESVRGVEDLLQPLLTSGKYDGIYYGKEDPRARRNLLFENVSLGLIRQVQTEPTLLCIEDLQWADPSSLALMHYVARNTRESKLLIIGTYRPEDIAATKEGELHQLVDVMQLMNREGLYREMELKRLEEVYTHKLLESLLGKVEVTSEFKRLLYKETEGNPLFVIELVKMLVEDGVLAKKDGIWVLTKNLEEISVPSRVRDVIVRRLGRLKENERGTLDYAAVAGEEFSPVILSEVMGGEKIHTLKILSTLEHRHRLIRPEGEKYKFDHAKIKEILFSEIPEMLRREYHALIAGSMEELCGDDLDEVVADLAYHYYRCKDKEKGALYLLKAADIAKKEFANKEAIRFYSEALELVDERPRMLEILKDLGDVLDLIGEYERATQSYREAANLTDEVRTKSGLQAKIGALFEKHGEYDKAIDICTEALERVEGEMCKEEALALNNIGVVHWSRGSHDKSLEFQKRSLVIREKIGDDSGIAASLHNIGNVHWSRGEYDEALDHYKKSLEIEEKIGSNRGIAASVHNIGNLRRDKGEYDTALEHYTRSLEILERIGDRSGIAASVNAIGNVHSDRGEYNRALECYEKSLEIAEKIGDQKGVALALSNIGSMYSERGEYNRALECYGKGLEIFEKMGYYYGLFRSYCELAETYVKKGDSAKASNFCHKALESSKQIDAKGDIGESRRIFGMIHSEQGKWDLAAESFEESIRIFEDLGIEFESGKSHYEFGLMWRERGDAERGKEHLNKAAGIFEKLKLERELEKVRAALSDLA
jgi:tetratricopeptide (TPR) repeat protein/predicted regulator of Ras-like GTPase activity (Roadblock/LC7/MglB family)